MTTIDKVAHHDVATMRRRAAGQREHAAHVVELPV